jgi:hypothetical protein
MAASVSTGRSRRGAPSVWRNALVLEVDEDAAVVFVVFLQAMILGFDMRLV